MKEITAEELLKTADANGNISISEDTRIIGDLYCKGDLDCKGYLYCKGDLDCKGYLDCKGDLYCKGDLVCKGNLGCKGDLYCKGYLYCNGNLVCNGYLYWSHASPPVAMTIKTKAVVPPAWQREYYESRLGMQLNGCYDTIIATLRPHLPELLAMDKWTPTERMMLESIKEAEK